MLGVGFVGGCVGHVWMGAGWLQSRRLSEEAAWVQRDGGVGALARHAGEQLRGGLLPRWVQDSVGQPGIAQQSSGR